MWQLFSYHLWSRGPVRLRVKKVYLPLFRAWKIEKEVHVIACIFSIAERWLSGRRRRSRKPLTGQPVRGFESPSLRQFYSQAFSLQKLTTEKSHLKFWVLYNDVESWCMLLLRMKKHCTSRFAIWNQSGFWAILSVVVSNQCDSSSIHQIFEHSGKKAIICSRMRKQKKSVHVPVHDSSPSFYYPSSSLYQKSGCRDAVSEKA